MELGLYLLLFQVCSKEVVWVKYAKDVVMVGVVGYSDFGKGVMEGIGGWRSKEVDGWIDDSRER